MISIVSFLIKMGMFVQNKNAETREVDIALAKQIRKILDNLSGLDDEDAKNSFREIFSRLNFIPAFEPFNIPLEHDDTLLNLKAEVIAKTESDVGESFRIIYLKPPKLTKSLRRKIVRELVDWDEKYANFIVILRNGDLWEIVSPVYFPETG